MAVAEDAETASQDAAAAIVPIPVAACRTQEDAHGALAGDRGNGNKNADC